MIFHLFVPYLFLTDISRGGCMPDGRKPVRSDAEAGSGPAGSELDVVVDGEWRVVGEALVLVDRRGAGAAAIPGVAIW